MNSPFTSRVPERRALLGSMGRESFVPSNARRSSTVRTSIARLAAPYFRSLIVCLLVIFIFTLSAHARINVTSLPGRDSVQLTIYNSADLTLVKETRLLTFRKGLNKLEFSWVNTLIDPTSVEFRALTRPDEIEVLDVSFPPRVTNTLEWRFNSEFAGEVTCEIRYFTSGISWSADYVAEVNQPEKLMQLTGNVRVTNNSGEDYENTSVRLVVGTIRLVENIADLARRGQERAAAEGQKASSPNRNLLRAVLELGDRMEVDGAPSAKDGRWGARQERLKAVAKEALSEYFLYTVEGRDTIPTGWSKRLPSFTAPGVPITALYKFERERWGAQVMRYLSFTNSPDAKLGKEPLPDGRVQAFRLDTPDRLLNYLGATAVKYIPINESVELELGADQNVLVKPTLMNWEKTNLAFDDNGNVKGWNIKETWKLELQNSRDIAVTVDVRRNFIGDWTLTTPDTNEKVDANKVKFLVPLKAREKRELTYELLTRLGTNAIR